MGKLEKKAVFFIVHGDEITTCHDRVIRKGAAALDREKEIRLKQVLRSGIIRGGKEGAGPIPSFGRHRPRLPLTAMPGRRKAVNRAGPGHGQDEKGCAIENG